MDKSNLRKQMLGVRRDIQTRIGKGEEIISNILSLTEIDDGEVIHCYLAMPDEVPTIGLIGRLFQDKKTVIVPLIREGKIVSSIFTASDSTMTVRGAPEPVNNVLYSGPIDIIIVPGVAFDQTGRRLGHGKGHYDHFLSTPIARGALKIGVAYSEQLCATIPIEPHDVSMDIVVTEKDIIRCRGGV